MDHHLEAITTHVSSLRATFRSHKTLSYDWRLRQLKALQRMVYIHASSFSEALKQDLNKSPTEFYMTEMSLVQAEIQQHLDNLQEWMEPQSVATDLVQLPGHSQVERQPFGVACILGSWNYPVQLTLMPLVGCIAAGNCALVRVPARSYCEATCTLLMKLLTQYLDNDAIRAVEGHIDVTTAILKQQFDFIFFTGGAFVGKIVARAAAEHLTPIVLELGGKSPAVVDSSIDIAIAAKRIVWGAFLNAGQTCVRPDYVLVDEKVAEEFVRLVTANIRQMYAARDDCGRIVNLKAFDRLATLLEHDQDFIAFGGARNHEELFIEPTVLDFGRNYKAFLASAAMRDEIFGPILPIYRYSHISEALEHINMLNKPLSLYIFTSNAVLRDQVLRETSSGGAVVNDCCLHVASSTLPFGGVGNSGMGNYHGKASFDAFSHQRAVLYRFPWLDLPQRYPPYTKFNSTLLALILAPRPRWQLRMIKGVGFMLLVWSLRSKIRSSPSIKAKLFQGVMKLVEMLS